MPTYTTNKQIIKPNNGEYPNTWNVPVNTDWDIIDKAFGSAFEVDVTSSDATPNAEACQNQRIDVTGFPSPSIRYVSFPATIGGMWVVNNKSNGTIRVTVVGSASYLVLTTTKKALIFSDGVNASFADDVRLVQGTGITVSGDTISLTSPVTTALGGTGQTTYTSGQLLIGNASGGLTKATLTAGTNVTITNGDGAITINSTSGGGGTGITSLTLAGGLTGLAFTPNTLTASGTMTLGGTLAVGSGGTGATSLTGYVFGNGSGVMTASSTIPSSAITPSLGNMSTQSASAVAITGGTITGVPASFASGSLTGTTLINSTGLITTTETITGKRIIANQGGSSVAGYSFATGTASFASVGGDAFLNFTTNTSIYTGSSGATLTISLATQPTATFTSNKFTLGGNITAAECYFGTTWTNISDARVKTDVTPYAIGTAALKQLRPVDYTYNGEYGTPDTGIVQTGLIAQEVLTTPLASMVGNRVYTDPQTGQQTTLYDLNTNQLVFALINAVKELDAPREGTGTEVKLEIRVNSNR